MENEKGMFEKHSIIKLLLLFTIIYLAVSGLLNFIIFRKIDLDMLMEDFFRNNLLYFGLASILFFLLTFRYIKKDYFRFLPTQLIKGMVIAFSIIFPLLLLKSIFYQGSLITHIIEWDKIFYTLIILFCACFLEEYLARYLLLMPFLKRNKPLLGITVVSALWSLMHYTNSGFNMISFINIFLVGILLSLEFIKSENITMPFFFHLAWNVLIGIIIGERLSGMRFSSFFTIFYDIPVNSMLFGGYFGIESSILLTMVLAFILIVFYRKDMASLLPEKYIINEQE